MALLSNVSFYRVWSTFPGYSDTAKILQPTAKSYPELLALAKILTYGAPPVIEPCFATFEDKERYRSKIADRARMSNEEIRSMLEGTKS